MLPIWMRTLAERAELETRLLLQQFDVEPKDSDLDKGLIDIIEDQNELRYGDVDEVDDSDY